jgi:hypothetical protein
MTAATGTCEAADIVTGMLHELWTLGNLEAASRYIHPRYTMVDERAEVRLSDREAFVEAVASFRGLLEEPWMAATHIISGQDMAAYRWELTARVADARLLSPPLRAIERHLPEVALLSHRGLSIVRLEDGLIAEEWLEIDNTAMRQQMGWWQ